MEGRKKGSKEVLEEKQMKRYFRSVKRAKGKNKKENKQSEVEIKATEATKIKATVKEEVHQQVTNKKLTSLETKKNKTNKATEQEKLPILKQKCATADSSEDLADWEIVPLPTETKQETKIQTNNEITKKKENNTSNMDVQDEIIDQNKLWVEEMNKVNEKMSSNLKNQTKVIEKTLSDTNFSKDHLVFKDINIQEPKDLKSNNEILESSEEDQTQENQTKLIEKALSDTNFSKEHLVFKDINIQEPKDLKSNNEILESSEEDQTQEFSPILYWRDPFPDITPLKVEDNIQNKRQAQDAKKEDPKKLKTKCNNKSSEMDVRNENNSQSEKRDNQSNQSIKIINSDQYCLGNVWLEKSKFDDAESKFYQKLAKQSNTKPKAETDNEEQKSMDPIKNNIEPRVCNIISEQTNEKKQMINKLVEKQAENLSLECQLERLETENTEFKQSLTHLNCFVKKLEVRVRTLESGSRSSSMTDEGVDMAGEQRCPFFEDCVCNSDSDDKSNIDNTSLNDGSEFEEFIATSSSQNCEACKSTLWKDDWEESSGQDLVAELRDNCKKHKNSY